MDYLNLGDDPSVRRLIAQYGFGDQEKVLFSAYVQKFNRRDAVQTRIILVSSAAFYNLDKHRKLKRRIDLAKVEGVAVSTISDEFVVHVPSEYDYRLASPRRDQAVSTIVHARFSALGYAAPMLHIERLPQAHLKDVTLLRTEANVKKAGPFVVPAVHAHKAGAGAGSAGDGHGSSRSLDPASTPNSARTAASNPYGMVGSSAGGGHMQALLAGTGGYSSNDGHGPYGSNAFGQAGHGDQQHHPRSLSDFDANDHGLGYGSGYAYDRGYGRMGGYGGAGSPHPGQGMSSGAGTTTGRPAATTPLGRPAAGTDYDEHSDDGRDSPFRRDAPGGPAAAGALASARNPQYGHVPHNGYNGYQQPFTAGQQQHSAYPQLAPGLGLEPRSGGPWKGHGPPGHGPAGLAPVGLGHGYMQPATAAAASSSALAGGYSAGAFGIRAPQASALHGAGSTAAGQSPGLGPRGDGIGAAAPGSPRLGSQGLGAQGAFGAPVVPHLPPPPQSPSLRSVGGAGKGTSGLHGQTGLGQAGLHTPGFHGHSSPAAQALGMGTGKGSPAVQYGGVAGQAGAGAGYGAGASAPPPPPLQPPSSGQGGKGGQSAPGTPKTAASSGRKDNSPRDPSSQAQLSLRSPASGAQANNCSGDANFTRDRSKSSSGANNSNNNNSGGSNGKVGLDDFELLRVVGRGSYGKVLAVRAKRTGEVLALKVLAKSRVVARHQVEHTQAERVILETIDHPFLVKLKAAFQTPTKLYLVLPFLRGGEVFHHLKARKRFDETLARFYIAEVALGIGHLHELGIVYRDLKPENVLLDDDGHVRLTDFGLSKVLLGPDDTAHTFCGTPEYLAPEVICGEPHDKAVDWWAVGVLLWEMLTGLPPFYDPNVQSMYDLIRQAQLVWPVDTDGRHLLSPHARSLLMGLLAREPHTRLGCIAPGSSEASTALSFAGGSDCMLEDVEQLKAHPFFHGLDWNALYHKRVPPPWRPLTVGSADVTHFDGEFTSEPLVDSVPSAAPSVHATPRSHGRSHHNNQHGNALHGARASKVGQARMTVTSVGSGPDVAPGYGQRNGMGSGDGLDVRLGAGAGNGGGAGAVGQAAAGGRDQGIASALARMDLDANSPDATPTDGTATGGLGLAGAAQDADAAAAGGLEGGGAGGHTAAEAAMVQQYGTLHPRFEGFTFVDKAALGLSMTLGNSPGLLGTLGSLGGQLGLGLVGLGGHGHRDGGGVGLVVGSVGSDGRDSRLERAGAYGAGQHSSVGYEAGSPQPAGGHGYQVTGSPSSPAGAKVRPGQGQGQGHGPGTNGRSVVPFGQGGR